MNEYAVINRISKRIVSIVTTANSLSETQAHYPECDVKPANDLPLEQLEAYRYFRERP